VALIVSAGLTEIALRWRIFVNLGGDLRSFGTRGGKSIAFAFGAVVAIVLLGQFAFGVNPVLGAMAVIVSITLAAVCARAAGQTDIAPYGPFGQISQLLFGLTAPGDPATNIVAASIVAGDAPQAVQTLYAFKTGYPLGATPRKQIYGQLLGMLVGSLAAYPAYVVLLRAYGVASRALPAPFALSFQALGRIAAHGSANLPHFAKMASLGGFVLGIALVLIGRTRFGRWVPGPIAIGVAFLIPAANVAIMVLGCIVGTLVQARWTSWAGRNLIPIAAGSVAGESFMGVIIAALIIAGVLPAPG
jgi:uncharacterized oligopeptide transporter (OPT) family protein